MENDQRSEVAPGHPGRPASWTSSAKSGVGTAAAVNSRVWFSIAHGVPTEVYFPTIQMPNTRVLECLVTTDSDFFSGEQEDTDHDIELIAPGVPGYRLTNTCKQKCYRLRKRLLTDPRRDVLVQEVEMEVLKGRLEDYRLYALLAPHVADQGAGNNGWVGEYKGFSMLFAERCELVIAMAASVPFAAASCGYIGTSDGWTDIREHRRMTRFHRRAPDGNISLTAELPLTACRGHFRLVLGFGQTPEEAAQQARAALVENFSRLQSDYVEGWQSYLRKSTEPQSPGGANSHLFQLSLSMIKTHQSKRYPGALIASLSIPWGEARGDDDDHGYHLVWARDMGQSAGAFLAARNLEEARQSIIYLCSTQERDGHWPQNMWLNGRGKWKGLQMDEMALPILLADALRREGELGDVDAWAMVEAAARFILTRGPGSEEDRWENTPGFSTYTLAVEVAALLAAADFADEAGAKAKAAFLRETADMWNTALEGWLYVKNTDLARRHGVEGYYVRVAAPEAAMAGSIFKGSLPLRDIRLKENQPPFEQMVSPDALALVRFGLRAPDDPRILNTIKVVDALTRIETRTGPVWHRYNCDFYGEEPDGRPFVSKEKGQGRGWPLLAGERAHYELAAGNHEEAIRLLKTMEQQTGPCGLLPEQVWEAEDIPERGLLNGHPSGSARPLVWAHAEYIKLLRSLQEKRIFDQPPQTAQRYLHDRIVSPHVMWGFEHRSQLIPLGKVLRVWLKASARVHWTVNDWAKARDTRTTDSQMGWHYADLPTQGAAPSGMIRFTFFWNESGHWEGQDYSVKIEAEMRKKK